MRTVGRIQVIDTQTGQVISEGPGLQLLPPSPDRCQVCAVAHSPHEPHDATSIYYQISFHAEHGSYPTWRDALAHCPDALREAWEAELTKRGIKLDGFAT